MNDRRPPTWQTGDGPHRLRAQAPHCPADNLCEDCQENEQFAVTSRNFYYARLADKIEALGHTEIAAEFRRLITVVRGT